jgi:hypothetical protein
MDERGCGGEGVEAEPEAGAAEEAEAAAEDGAAEKSKKEVEAPKGSSLAERMGAEGAGTLPPPPPPLLPSPAAPPPNSSTSPRPTLAPPGVRGVRGAAPRSSP